MIQTARLALFVLIAALLAPAIPARAEEDPSQFIVYPGGEGPGKGKHIVLLSGDEEYRSEETMPMLGKILSQRHGFKCTVLFPIDPKTGEISPKTTNNTPGLAALDSADLLIILTRFRNYPDDAMKHIDDFLKAGKPVIGLRTATHGFNGLKGEYAKYNNGFNDKTEGKEWQDGFGRLVLGEKWISHHGGHKVDSTRAIFAEGANGDPILSGIADGEIWGPTDVYGVRLPLPGDSKPLLLGQVVKRAGAKKDPPEDPFYGMAPTDKEPVAGAKNNPMMPIAWTKSYKTPGGKQGKAFTTTLGSSTDFVNEGLRRLVVNATYALLDLKVPEKADVTIVGEFKPLAYGFDGNKKGVKPADVK